MRTGLRNLPRLCYRSILPGKDSPARVTPRRLAVLTAFLPLFVTLQLANRFFLRLDDLLFRAYRNVSIEAPVFVTGVPRSGTTFLHRLLALDEDRVTTFTLWELIFAPSITQRAIFDGIGRVDRCVGSPLLRTIRAIERLALSDLQDIHPTSLESPEEDYLGLTSILGCFLLVLPFPFYDELWYLSRFDDEATDAERKRLMALYRGLVQRHLYWHGPEKRYLSKNPSFSAMVGCLRTEFPDAKFVCCLRTPEKVYPSLLNSMTEGAKGFGNDLQGDTYWRHLGDMLAYYYDHLVEEFDSLGENRGDYVTMDRLVKDPTGTVRRLANRFDWKLEPDYLEALDEEERKSRQFKSKHKYSLDQFNMTPDDLHHQFHDLYERFEWKTEAKHASTDDRKAS